MQRQSVSMSVVVVALLAGVRVESMGAIPNYGIRYVLPADEVTGDYYVIRLQLTPESQSGNNVGWGVTKIDIRLLNRFEIEQGRWIDTAPAVATADGLIWVLHEDPEAPELAEFETLPKIGGLADDAGQSPSSGMEYDIESAESTSYSATTSLVAQMNYRLKFEEEEEAATQGDDAPVVVDEDESDPVAADDGGPDVFCERLDDRDRVIPA